MKKGILPWLALLVTFACAAISISRGIHNALDANGNSSFIWDSSRALLLRVDPYIRSDAWTPIEKERGDTLWATYPPASLVIVAPLAELHWRTAKAVWLAVNVFLTLSIFLSIRRLWLREVGARAFCLFALLVCASTPWRVLTGLGQQTLFSVAFFLLGYQQALKGRRFAAGALLALSFLKYTITGPLLLWMAVSGFGAAVGWAFLVQCLLTGLAAAWLHVPVTTLMAEYLASAKNAVYWGCTDIFAFCNSLSNTTDHRLYVVIFVSGTAALLLWALTRGHRDALWELGLISCWCLLIVYHSFYDLFVLVFVLALLARDGFHTRWLWIPGIALVELWYGHRLLETTNLANSAGFETKFVFFEVFSVFICLAFLKTPTARFAGQQ